MKPDPSKWLDRINAINAIINPLLDERSELEQKLIESKSPFKIGDIIEWKVGNGIGSGRVIHVEEWVCGQPMWVVRRILHNGNEGGKCEVRSYMNPRRSKRP